MGVGVARRTQILLEQHEGAAVGLILQSLAALVLDDVALVIQLLLGEHVGQRGQAVRFDPENVFQIGGGYGGEIVGAVLGGGAVHASGKQAGAGFLQKAEILSVGILRAFEHHVLEQMGEAGAARALVLRADVIPAIHVDHGQLAVHVQDDVEAVGQGKFFEFDLRRVLGKSRKGSPGQRSQYTNGAPHVIPPIRRESLHPNPRRTARTNSCAG